MKSKDNPQKKDIISGKLKPDPASVQIDSKSPVSFDKDILSSKPMHDARQQLRD